VVMGKTVAIVQARVSSTRLPGKVLMGMAGQPMLLRVLFRVCKSHLIDEIVVATTILDEDAAICDLCDEYRFACFQGRIDDVLDRYYRLASIYKMDNIVRITGDCPVIDPEVIDQVISKFLETGADYTSNIFPKRTYPRGLDTEVMTFKALERVWMAARKPSHREHVTTYIRDNPKEFNISSISIKEDHSDLQWSVDTSEDFGRVQSIYEHFKHDRFSWREVLK